MHVRQLHSVAYGFCTFANWTFEKDTIDHFCGFLIQSFCCITFCASRLNLVHLRLNLTRKGVFQIQRSIRSFSYFESQAKMVQTNLLEISSQLIHDALYETIESMLKTRNYKINLSLASKIGENNFVGIVYRVLIMNEDQAKERSASNLILKLAPQNEAHRAQCCARPAFLREIHMYNKVPEFISLFFY